MMSYPLIQHFFFAFLGTLGFCILFHVPLKHIVPASFGGSAGWVAYVYFTNGGTAPIAACFASACLVSLLAEFFSKAGKEATTIFIIPGIIPLVPGAPLYYTMRAILTGDFDAAAYFGTQALFMAGSIAIALLLIASLTRLFGAIKGKLKFT